MPTYQYACTDPECGTRFELVQAFTDPAVTSCPVCTSAVRKVYGSVGVVFKGSGFYRNDSRSEGGKGGDKGDSADSGSAAKDTLDSGAAKDGASSASKDSASKDSASKGTASKGTESSAKGGGSTTSSSSGSSTSSGKAAASA